MIILLFSESNQGVTSNFLNQWFNFAFKLKFITQYYILTNFIYFVNHTCEVAFNFRIGFPLISTLKLTQNKNRKSFNCLKLIWISLNSLSLYLNLGRSHVACLRHLFDVRFIFSISEFYVATWSKWTRKKNASKQLRDAVETFNQKFVRWSLWLITLS